MMSLPLPVLDVTFLSPARFFNLLSSHSSGWKGWWGKRSRSGMVTDRWWLSPRCFAVAHPSYTSAHRFFCLSAAVRSSFIASFFSFFKCLVAFCPCETKRAALSRGSQAPDNKQVLCFPSVYLPISIEKLPFIAGRSQGPTKTLRKWRTCQL